MKKSVCLLAIIAFVVPVFAKTLVVDPNGHGGFVKVQDAINAAKDGDTVLVAPGVYKELLVLKGKTLTLGSYYLKSKDESYIKQTVIDGQGEGPILLIRDAGRKTTVIGLTFRNSNPSVTTYSKIDFLHNYVYKGKDGMSYEGGGGVCKYNVFEDCPDESIDCDGAVDVEISYNVLRGHHEDGIEIRLHKYSGPLLTYKITNNVIIGSGNRGDGIQLIDYPDVSDRVFYIENNVFYDSVQSAIGCMDKGDTGEDYRAASIPEPIYVINNTFYNNNYGITGGDSMVVKNNIFAKTKQTALKNVDGRSMITYNAFWQNGSDFVGTKAGAGNIIAEPLFFNGGAGDFHLKSSTGRWTETGWVPDDVKSLCINAGDPCDAIGNEPQPNGGRINMGAYGGTGQASK